MHRVYNSAFMHMLRDEDNAKYRLAIKNTLEFDPQILRRYVNFMSNPDEKTAIEQFGTGDKYFGVCTVLCTLPGLPMFGHGQVEGYREKYGMEFRMPKWDEVPDEGLMRGHEWKIFPLLHRRALFADVEHFLLFDLFRDDGSVDENVLAYSNRSESGERGLIVYHNKFAETRGWVHVSAAALDKGSGRLIQRSLAHGLELPHSGYAVFRDYVSHLEYIRSCAELWEKGLFLQLSAYQHHSFLDWRLVDGPEWQAVHDALNGSGVTSMDGQRQALAAAREAEQPVATQVTARRRSAKKGTAKKAAPAKKAAVKKSQPEQPASKPAAKKGAVKKAPAKRPAPKKAAKKTATKKMPAPRSSTGSRKP
jgi:hypothetical protein